MKRVNKGILDNDMVISAENVQKMGEIIALTCIKTVIVRSGKDLHYLYNGLTVAFSIGMSICGATLAFVFICSAISHLTEYNNTQRGRKLRKQQQRLEEIKYNIIILQKKQQKILDSYDEQTRVATGDETINNFILSQSDERFSENKTFINNIN